MLRSYPTKPCRFCDKRSHFPYQCYKNPKRKKYIKKQGKVANQWAITRKEWFRKNPPEQSPYPHYVCYLPGHGEWLLPNETTLDHVKSRSRHPELRFVLANLKPCCWQGNQEKGSKDGELWSII